MKRAFTGRDMAMVLIGGFGIVVAVNFYMASVAIGGFGGVVVENSYVASQKYNGWLDEARRSDALGYSAELERDGEGRLRAILRGVPQDASLSAQLRRPLGQPDDRTVQFRREGEGRYLARQTLPQGRWIARLTVDHGTQRWVHEVELP